MLLKEILVRMIATKSPFFLQRGDFLSLIRSRAFGHHDISRNSNRCGTSCHAFATRNYGLPACEGIEIGKEKESMNVKGASAPFRMLRKE